MNALCSFLSGQLIRGDAILTASLTSPGQAQSWVNSIMSKSQNLNASEEKHSSLMPRDSSTQDATVLDAARVKDGTDPAANLEPLQEEYTESLAACARDDSASDIPELSSQAASEAPPALERKQIEYTHRQREAPRPARAPHAASAVPDGDYEPRTRLLWSIVSQASSVKWDRGAPGAAAASRLAAPAEDEISKEHLKELTEDTLGQNPLAEEISGMQTDESAQESTEAGLQQESFRDEDGSCGLQYVAQHKCDWADLQPELLGCIGKTFRAAGPLQQMASTCR